MSSPGLKGPNQFILIFSPYQVLYEIQSSDEGRIQAQYWLALIERAEEIGARDIEKYEEGTREILKKQEETNRN